MKRISFASCASVLAGAFVLGSSSVAAAATDRVTIALGPVAPTYAIYAAAKELGYYAAQNLDVEIQTFRSGAAAQDALAAGNADLCPVVPLDAERAIAGGVKERIVAMFAPARATGWYIMVPSASPLVTAADLNGKSVGVNKSGSLADFRVQRVARSLKIRMTSVPLDAGVEAGLRAKRVDAAVLWPPASYGGLMDGDLRALVDLEAALPPTVSEGIAASSDLIDRRPDVLRRWLSATSNAIRYMQGNEDWSEGFLKRYYGDADDQSIDMLYRNVILKINPSGAMHPDWMKTSLALGAPAGATKLPEASLVFLTAPKPKKGR